MVELLHRTQSIEKFLQNVTDQEYPIFGFNVPSKGSDMRVIFPTRGRRKTKDHTEVSTTRFTIASVVLVSHPSRNSIVPRAFRMDRCRRRWMNSVKA